MVHMNSTPRYMEAVRNHVQVYARFDRSNRGGTRLQCFTPYSANGGLNESSQRILQARYDTYYDMLRKAYNLNGLITNVYNYTYNY